MTIDFLNYALLGSVFFGYLKIKQGKTSNEYIDAGKKNHIGI